MSINLAALACNFNRGIMASITDPLQWRKQATLHNGTPLVLRAILPQDDQKMLRLFDRLSADTVYFRFMTMVKRFSDSDIKRFTHIDFTNDMAIVATLANSDEPEGEKLVAVGRYARLTRPERGEVAITVEDALQKQGIGTLLWEELLPFARNSGIEILEAEVLAENHRMLGLFRDSGYPATFQQQGGTVHVEISIGAIGSGGPG